MFLWYKSHLIKKNINNYSHNKYNNTITNNCRKCNWKKEGECVGWKGDETNILESIVLYSFTPFQAPCKDKRLLENSWLRLLRALLHKPYEDDALERTSDEWNKQPQSSPYRASTARRTKQIMIQRRYMKQFTNKQRTWCDLQVPVQPSKHSTDHCQTKRRDQRKEKKGWEKIGCIWPKTSSQRLTRSLLGPEPASSDADLGFRGVYRLVWPNKIDLVPFTVQWTEEMFFLAWPGR